MTNLSVAVKIFPLNPALPVTKVLKVLVPVIVWEVSVVTQFVGISECKASTPAVLGKVNSLPKLVNFIPVLVRAIPTCELDTEATLLNFISPEFTT